MAVVETESTRASSELIDKAVNELFMEEENKGFRRGELKPFIEGLAEKYEISFHSIKNRYYKEVQGKAKKTNVAKKRTAVATKVDKKTKETNINKFNVTDENDNKVIEPQIQIEPKEETKEEVEVSPKVTIQTENKPKQKYNLDENIHKHNTTTVDKFISLPKDHYFVGQMVDVKVANLQSYGAFCEILDGKGFQALCHVSEMLDGFIKDVSDYVLVGDVIKGARICMIEDKRINITIKHLHISKREKTSEPVEVQVAENPPVNVIGEKFGDLKDKLMQRASTTIITKEEERLPVVTNDEKEVEEVFALEEVTVKQDEIIKKYERDINEMTSYLTEELGVLSHEAKLELAKLIEEEGVFRTTRGMMKTQEDFKADIGLLFMQQMRSKLGEYL